MMTSTAQHHILTAYGADTVISGPRLVDGYAVPPIAVIAHSLAQINRFAGHTRRPYSVAEHSLLVCDIVAARGLDCHAQMLALLHDAHECLCGDVVTPVKRQLGIAWAIFENPLALAVRNAHGLRCAHTAYSKCVRWADLTALATERRDLTFFDAAHNHPWPDLDNGPRPVLPIETDLRSHQRERHTWNDWRAAFIDRFHRLEQERCTSATTPPNPVHTATTASSPA